MAKMDYGTIAEIGSPRWLQDFRSRDHLIPGGIKLDAAAFPKEGTVVVTVAAAGAPLAAVSIPLASAIPAGLKIPSGTVLNFTGVGEFALLTADANPGATALTVEALDAAIEAGDTATYVGTGKRLVKSGTFVGRTIAERDAAAPFGPVADGDADAESYLLAFSVEDLDEDNDGVLVRPGSVVKENYLPNIAAYTATQLTRLRARYHCVRGVA